MRHSINGATCAIGRRGVLTGALATSAALGGNGVPSRRAHAEDQVTLTFAVWGGHAEEDAFNGIIAKYEAQHPNVKIRLEVSGNSMQVYQLVDTRLAGRQAPDLFRIQYQQVGRYASSRALVDLGPYLEPGYASQFGPAFWQAVTLQGHTFALPHHTDTFALYYNVDYFEKLGIAPPRTLDASFPWEEFVRIAHLLQQKAGAPYGFAMAWQNAAYRWLPFLYQHGGQLLDAELRHPQIATATGIETIAWTQSWFRDGLVPPSTSIKSNEQTQNLFANGTIGMLLGGDWQIPFLNQTMTKFRWDVTYMPRDAAMASDLGGNCVAISRDSKNRDAAADFLKFLVNEGNMRAFVSAAQFLPVRASLMQQGVTYATRPDAMKVYVQQASTIPEHLVRTGTLPNFSRINAAMTDELDLAFTSGQDPTTTARNLSDKIATVLGG